MEKTKSLVAGVALAAVLWCPSVSRAEVTVFKTKDPKLPKMEVGLFGWVQPRLAIIENDVRPFIDYRPNPFFTLTRARLGATGRIDDWGLVQLELAFERELAFPIDAFVQLKPSRHEMAAVTFTLGQFRVPFSRQNLLNGRVYQLPDTAYFALPRYLVDRDIGAQVTGDFWKHRIRLHAGVFNGNEPGRGQTLNIDANFLAAARLEISPLGPPEKTESDLRSEYDRHMPTFQVAGGAMYNRRDDVFFDRVYAGADAVFQWEGVSLYGEFYFRHDTPVCLESDATGCKRPITLPDTVEAIGGNVQLGYFPHIPWVHEHLEAVGRFQYFDPNTRIKTPTNDVGARELDQTNAQWGYWGFTAGLNYYVGLEHRDDLKVQASYELRNEVKECLEGQTLAAGNCTGFIANNVFLLQANAGF